MKRMNSAAAQAMPKKSHSNSNIAMPDYWQHLGLSKDPLGKSLSDDASYTPPKWEEYLDTLQDICHTKNALLSIIGVTGSGKTTLLKQFLAQIGSNMQICQIDAQADFDHTLLVETLASGFKLSIPDEDSAEEQLDAQLVEMQQYKKPCLLAIDNAHLLQSEMLQAICDLIAQQSQAQMRLHILLVGEIPLHARFDALDLPPEQVYVTTLEGFSLEETDQYLQHRLAAAGHNGEILFSQAAVMRIYRLSSGIPGRINRLAQRMLQNALAAPAEIPPLLSSKQVKFLGAGLLIALLAVIALGLTYINSRHQSVTKAKKVQPILEKSLVSPTLAQAITAPTNNAVTTPNKAATTLAQTISVQQAEALMLKGTTAPAVAAKTEVVADKASATDGNALATVLLAEEIKKSDELATKNALEKPTEISNKSLDNANHLDKTIASNKGVESSKNSEIATDASPVTTPSAPVASKATMADTLPVISDDDEVNVSSDDLPTTSRTPVEIAVTTPGNVKELPAKPVVVADVNKPVLTKSPAAVTLPTKEAVVLAENNKVSVKPPVATEAVNNQSSVAIAEQPGQFSQDEQGLLSLSPKNFSLQIIGSHQQSTVQQFLAKSGLSSKGAHIFQTKFQGEDWYVLTYGQYTSAHAAQAAIATLPKMAKALKPWPRKVADIQSAIKQ